MPSRCHKSRCERYARGETWCIVPPSSAPSQSETTTIENTGRSRSYVVRTAREIRDSRTKRPPPLPPASWIDPNFRINLKFCIWEGKTREVLRSRRWCWKTKLRWSASGGRYHPESVCRFMGARSSMGTHLLLKSKRKRLAANCMENPCSSLPRSWQMATERFDGSDLRRRKKTLRVDEVTSATAAAHG